MAEVGQNAIEVIRFESCYLVCTGVAGHARNAIYLAVATVAVVVAIGVE